MSKVLEESSLGGTTPTSSASPPESKKREKTIPHYLRASTGSCHDLCKYGHKNPSEEVLRFSGGRRKKLPNHLNNLALNRSAILDSSKDVRNRSLSLPKSSISLGEAERVAPKLISANRKGLASNDHLVPRTASSAEHKHLNSDGRNKHSMVAEKAPTDLRYSSGVPKIDKKETIPARAGISSAKSNVSEKTLPDKSRTVDKVTTVKLSLLKRPASSPIKLNKVTQVPVTSASSQHLLSSKDKNAPKGKVTSPSATTTGVRAKPGRSPMRSSNGNSNGKEVSDMSRPPFSMESKLIARAEIQEDLQVTGYSLESIPAQLSSDATERVDNSRLAPEATSKSISGDVELGGAENNEALAGEAALQSDSALELQNSLNGKEFNAVLREPDPENELAEQNVMDVRSLNDEDSQTDDAPLCDVSEQLSAVENADAYDPVLSKSNPKTEDDHVKIGVCVEPLNADGKEEVRVHEDLQRSPEIVALDEKHVEEPVSCLDFASANAAENDNVDEVLDTRMDNCVPQCQSISETSSDGELLEEPKSMLIEPSDPTIQIDELASVSKENNELEVLESMTFIPRSPEELSNDEFYEEYVFEFSGSDESGTEVEEETGKTNMDESLNAGGRRPRRISALELDDTNITPYKLKFKRGKIVDLPPDSNGPRRLRFRRKAANEVLNGESLPARRIYKRNSANSAVLANPDLESSSVKLRHQDAQEKKDAQGLFNNVIKETASKLVESRKSKVKALVGAFETVISLQDGKPTSSTPQAGNSQDSVYAHEEAE